MSFFDNQLNDIKDKISGAFNPFENKGSFGNLGGLGGLLDSAMDGVTDAFDNIFDSVSGIFKPQFETKEAAEASLFNSQPEPIPRGSIYESSIQDASKMRSPNDPLHIRNFVRQEFTNREHDFGLYYTHGTNGEAIDGQLPDNPMEYTGEIYRGPRTAWCRMTSNAVYTNPKDGNSYEGFVMNGVSGFEDTYGFSDLVREDSTSILGYDVNGKPHVMEEPRFKHRPCPGLTGVESSLVNLDYNGRDTTVNFVCWSRAQLDYLEPYFFAPQMTVVVEWGWNNYPRDSLLDLTDVGSSKVSSGWQGIPSSDASSSGLVALYADPEFGSKLIEKGRGNYYAMVGMITKFEYAIRDDGGYDCTINVVNIGGTAMHQKTTSGKVSCGKKELTEEQVQNKTDDLEQRTFDFKDFIGDEVTSYLEGGMFKDDTYTGGGFLNEGEYLAGGKDKFTAGRYFTPDTLNAKKDYEFGFSSKSYYITFGLFIDFVNDFFAREVYSSTGSTTDLFKFTCEDTRISAHPNIKSNDGSVLLIPNSTSPRRNDKINTAIENNIISSSRGISSEELKKAIMSSSGTGKVGSLASALKKFPRDDLYDILSTQAIALGNARERIAWNVDTTTGESKKIMITEQAVKPFPDYANGSGGYSGRLKDLFVNIETIRQAVNTQNTVKGFTMDVLKKMSTAVGGVWDFSFTSEDKSTPNCPITAIVDNNYGGPNSVAEIDRSGQTYIFKSHQKNSIVKGLNLNVSLTSGMATDIIGSAGASDASKESRMFSSSAIDRVFKKVPQNTRCRGGNASKENQKKSEIEDSEKYIVRKEIVIPGLGNDEEYLIEMADTQLQRVLTSMREDKNPKNNVNFNGPVNDVEIEIELLGISGLRAMECFQCTGIPTSYYERGHFRITNIKDSLADGNWTTTITALYYFNSAERR